MDGPFVSIKYIEIDFWMACCMRFDCSACFLLVLTLDHIDLRNYSNVASIHSKVSIFLLNPHLSLMEYFFTILVNSLRFGFNRVLLLFPGI